MANSARFLSSYRRAPGPHEEETLPDEEHCLRTYAERKLCRRRFVLQLHETTWLRSRSAAFDGLRECRDYRVQLHSLPWGPFHPFST